jgi:hypothetical protein
MRLEKISRWNLGVVRDMMRSDPCGLEQKTMAESPAVIFSSSLCAGFWEILLSTTINFITVVPAKRWM